MSEPSRSNLVNSKILGSTAGCILIVLGIVFTDHQLSRWFGVACFVIVQGTIAWNWRRDLIELEEYRDMYLSK